MICFEVIAVENKTVLSALSGGLYLSEINLAGTHDSATAYCAFPKLAKCQELTFREQLALGVRLLDIRLFRRGNRFYLVHGMADCYTDETKREKLQFDEVLAVCKEFLRKNPRETLVLSIKQDRGHFETTFFERFYHTYIEPDENLWYLENRVPHLAECCGKLVLMRRCKRASDFRMADNCGLDFSVWENQDSKTETAPCEVALSSACTATVQDRYRLPPEMKWDKSAKPFLEACRPTNKQICIHFLSTCGGAGCPAENAPLVNAAFSEYPLSKTHAQGWFFLDFPTEALCRKIMLSNLEIYKGECV
ncbi:MAG: phosphatidylinositol-specific phospholipase C domain-containing protein [Candidatus Fimenecus sp.]